MSIKPPLNGGLTLAHLSAFCAQVRTRFPDCEVIIAGGAVRDVFHGREVKDIDVFIGTPDCNPARWKQLESQATVLALDLHYWAQGKGEYGTAKPLNPSEGKSYSFAGFRVLNIDPGFRSFPTQLIFRQSTDLRKDAIETFDFGICQCWVDERGMRSSDAFKRDSAAKTLSYVSDAWDLGDDSHADHRARLEAKYPGWKYRDVRSSVLNPSKPQVSITTWGDTGGWYDPGGCAPCRPVNAASVENDLPPLAHSPGWVPWALAD